MPGSRGMHTKRIFQMVLFRRQKFAIMHASGGVVILRLGSAALAAAIDVDCRQGAESFLPDCANLIFSQAKSERLQASVYVNCGRSCIHV